MILHIKIKPNSKKELIQKVSDKEYKVELKEPPENNKANKRLINLLSKEFKVPAKNIKIKTPSSRNKIIEIISLLQQTF